MFKKKINKKKTVLLNLSAGIGNGIVWHKAIYFLRQEYDEVHGFFQHSVSLEALKSLNFLDNYILIENPKKIEPKLLGYDLYISDYLINDTFFIASFLSFSKLNSFRPKKFITKIKYNLFPHVNWVKMDQKNHISDQLLYLIKGNADINIKIRTKNKKIFSGSLPQIVKNKNYIVIQLSSGDSADCYKNWDFSKWNKLLEKLNRDFSSIYFIFLGGGTERTALNQISLNKNMIDLIGKTNIKEAFKIIENAKLFIGLDSGLMHLSHYLNISTISIFGPSCITAWGYEKNYNKNKHYVITSQVREKERHFCPIDCNPCEMYSLKELTVNRVYKKIKNIIEYRLK